MHHKFWLSMKFGSHVVGCDIQPKRDVTRFVKWPKYIRLQRQKAVLQKRLKIPPPVNQFRSALDKQTCKKCFSYLSFHQLGQYV